MVGWVDRDGRDQGKDVGGKGRKVEIGAVNTFSFLDNHSPVSI